MVISSEKLRARHVREYRLNGIVRATTRRNFHGVFTSLRWRGGEGRTVSQRPRRDAPKSSGHFFTGHTKRRGRLHKVGRLHLSTWRAQTAAVATTYGLVLMLNYRWTYARHGH